MEASINPILLLTGCYLLLFACGECLYHVFQVKVEITRKIVHIGTGLLALLFPLLLNNHWEVLLLCASFALILVISIRYGLLKSIHAIDRKSVGSLAYPVAVYGCYLMFLYHDKQYIYYYLPILILAIADPVAALTGKKWAWGKYRIAGADKTLLGSAMFFCSTVFIMLCCWLFLYTTPQQAGSFALAVGIIALVATLAEAVSSDGYDNLTIPLSVFVALFLTKSWLI